MTTLMTVLMSAMVAFAAPTEKESKGKRGPKAKGPNIERMAERIIDVVDASEEQAGQINTILKEAQDKFQANRADRQKFMDEHREEIQAIRKEMREAREAGDEEKLAELRDQLKSLRETSETNPMQDAVTQIEQILTDEQQEKFDSIKERLMKQRGKGHNSKEGKQKGFQVKRFLNHVAKTVEATDEQRKQLEEIGKEFNEQQQDARKAHRDAMRENRDKIRELHTQLREANQEGDAEKAEQLKCDIRALMDSGQLGTQVDALFVNIEEILTDEQKVKFEPLKEQLTQRLEAEQKDRKNKKMRDHKGRKGKQKGKRGGRGLDKPASVE